MTFEFTTSKDRKYFLHSKQMVLKSGHTRQIYFFAREVKTGEGITALNEVPEGYEVSETKTGLPVLRKIK